MKTYLIGYDLNAPGKKYVNLHKKIRSLGSWWHRLGSTWLVACELTPAKIRDALKPFLDSNDELLVVRVTKKAVWLGFERDRNWLQAHIGR